MKRQAEIHHRLAVGLARRVEGRKGLAQLGCGLQRVPAHRLAVERGEIEGRQETVAQKLQDLAVIGMHRPRHQLQIIVERLDQLAAGQPV